MTSNLGSSIIFEEKDPKRRREKIMLLLRQTFRPEFLNRIDEIIIFNNLGKKELEKIVDLQIGRIKERLKKQGIELTITKEAKKLLAKEGFDPDFGARPLKRVIQRKILDEIALLLVERKIKEGDKIKIEAKNNQIVFYY